MSGVIPGAAGTGKLVFSDTGSGVACPPTVALAALEWCRRQKSGGAERGRRGHIERQLDFPVTTIRIADGCPDVPARRASRVDYW